MTNRLLILYCLAFACIFAKAQSSPAYYLPITLVTQPGSENAIASNFINRNVDSTANIHFSNVYYLQKSRAQTINGFVLIAGGSVIGSMSIRNGLLDRYAQREISQKENGKYTKVSGAGLAFTGLVLMAGSIPYFISALKNKNKGLKLTSQKTSFGSCNRDYKKVTSLTYSIAIGR